MILRVTYPSEGPCFEIVFDRRGKAAMLPPIAIAAGLKGRDARYVTWYYKQKHCTVEEIEK